ncbi:MAG TPA: hypothetical protein VMD92_00655 [Acidobacteriaceae bacterium]|nr:hypothetical protein [Acidobacteriaceae bacterium]
MTDILLHSISAYGEEADALIRKIADLSSPRELSEWWEREIGWHGNEQTVLQKGRLQLDLLTQRAREAGWEVQG